MPARYGKLVGLSSYYYKSCCTIHSISDLKPSYYVLHSKIIQVEQPTRMATVYPLPAHALDCLLAPQILNDYLYQNGEITRSLPYRRHTNWMEKCFHHLKHGIQEKVGNTNRVKKIFTSELFYISNKPGNLLL